MAEGVLGMISTPFQKNAIVDGALWCADNGCFGKGYPGDVGWLSWLDEKTVGQRSRCLFATAPDVVGDAGATWERSERFLPEIRLRGYPAALVAQDGLEDLEVPWDSVDALFIGGSTEWKLGETAAALGREAKARGKWLHMGRVNSRKRFRYAKSIGCDSVDGTYLTFGPDINLPKLLRWIEEE